MPARKSSNFTAQNRTAFFVVLLLVSLVGTVAIFSNQIIPKSSGVGLQHVVSYQGQKGQNALELLKKHHKVEAQHFSIGDFVTSIDGISAPTNYYWSFYVNGKASDVGAGQYVTKNSDLLSWKLVKIQ